MSVDGKNKTTINIIWRSLHSIGTKGIEFIVQIILARLLMPEDFGILAILAIFSSLANTIVNNGLGTSLLQKKNATETDFSTVFFIELILSIFVYCLLFVLAPTIANYYENENITMYLRVYTLIVLMSPFSSIQTTVLRKTANFKTMFIANFVAIIFQAVSGLVLAYCGMGVWSLVISQLLYYFASSFLLCVLVRWKPTKKLSFNSFLNLFKFSWKMTIGWIIGTVYNDVFSLIVGKKYNSETLGYYSKAQTIPNTMNQIVTQVTSSVMFPEFSKIQDNTELTKERTRIMIAILSALLFPIMAGIAAAGNEIISILITDKWLPCVPMMQIMCIYFALSVINDANMQSITGIGRSDLFMIFEIIKRSIAIILVIFLSKINIYLMIWSVVFTTILSLAMNGIANKKLFKYKFSEYVFDIVPYLLYSILLFLIVYFVSKINANKYALFCLELGICIIYYIGLFTFSKLKGFKFIREIILKFLRKKAKAKG